MNFSRGTRYGTSIDAHSDDAGLRIKVDEFREGGYNGTNRWYTDDPEEIEELIEVLEDAVDRLE